MFNFLKRLTKKQEVVPTKPVGGPTQKTAVAQRHAEQQYLEAQEIVWRVGQTMRFKGLGDFLIHDIKGGEGKSGMGIVYIVLDADSMPFAIKTLQHTYLETPELVRQFTRECETWIKLERHENIVRAHYVGLIGEQPYVFLEYVSGADLRKKLMHGALPQKKVLRYGIQFCRGMAHACTKMPGLVHRDVKPENCLLSHDDVLKITDFGLVKVLASSGQLPKPGSLDQIPDDSQSRHFTTAEGEMGVGTMPYMAPEQFTNFSGVTVKADIYSFGVMFYELLTGNRPFKAFGLDNWYAQHLTFNPPDPSAVNPEVNRTLSQITMRCLAKAPEQRYGEFSEIERELSLVLLRDYGEELAAVAPQQLEVWEVLNKGTALLNLGRNKQALACFEKALKLSPDADAAWLNKGVILAGEGRHREALECYNRAVEINPNSPTAWYNRGFTCQTQDMLEEAMTSYDRALELDPYIDSAWLNKGVILRKTKRAREAVACYDRALALNPSSAVGWYNKGFALRQLGNSQEELHCYDRALALAPENVDIWLNKGAALSKLSRFIEAVVCYDRVLACDPRHAAAWYNKGIVLRKMGQRQQAQYAFQKAAVLDPRIAADLKRQRLYTG